MELGSFGRWRGKETAMNGAMDLKASRSHLRAFHCVMQYHSDSFTDYMANEFCGNPIVSLSDRTVYGHDKVMRHRDAHKAQHISDTFLS